MQDYQPSMPKTQGLVSFDKILSYYKTKYNQNRQYPQPKNGSIVYNNAIYYTPRYKSYRKQTIRTIHLNKISKQDNQQRGDSFTKLRQKMKQKINYFSIKKEYDNLLQSASDQQLIQRLKFDLLHTHKVLKNPNKRYTKNQIFQENPKTKSNFGIMGSKFQRTNKSMDFVKTNKNLPEINYKTNYLSKSKQEKPDKIKSIREQDENITGWKQQHPYLD